MQVGLRSDYYGWTERNIVLRQTTYSSNRTGYARTAFHDEHSRRMT